MLCHCFGLGPNIYAVKAEEVIEVQAFEKPLSFFSLPLLLLGFLRRDEGLLWVLDADQLFQREKRGLRMSYAPLLLVLQGDLSLGFFIDRSLGEKYTDDKVWIDKSQIKHILDRPHIADVAVFDGRMVPVIDVQYVFQAVKDALKTPRGAYA